DRADVRIDGPRSLGKRQAFVLDEDHHLALKRGQRTHGPADDVAHLAAIEVDRLRNHRLIIERLEPMLGAPVLEREVPGDPEEEGARGPACRIKPLWIA